MRLVHLIKIALIVLLTAAHVVLFADSLDPRCCQNPIARDSDGRISRSAKVLADFKRMYPCPSTGLKTGACPGWQIDHVVPLSCQGLDAIQNLQWLKNEIKTCGEDYCKDRWERKVYCNQ